MTDNQNNLNENFSDGTADRPPVNNISGNQDNMNNNATNTSDIPEQKEAEPQSQNQYSSQPNGKNEQGKKKRKTFLETEEAKILWKDRKRFMGMPLSFTRYEVDESRFTSRVGFFSTTTNETLLYRILDLKMTQTLWQKTFRVGTIILFTADKSHSTFTLKNIKHPEKLRRYLSNLVEQERDKRRITGRELFGVAGESGMLDMPDLNGDGLPG